MPRAEPLPGVELTRDPLDFNRTPAGMVQAILPHLGTPRTVLDVGCGDGAIGKVLRQAWPNVDISGVELDERRWKAARLATSEPHWAVYHAVWQADWLGAFCDGSVSRVDLIISNPPFTPALAFLRRSLERVAPGGKVAFLLPIHWDTEQETKVVPGRNTVPRERQTFLDSLRLPDGREGYGVYPIEGRWSFRGGTQGPDRYAWFVFGPGHAGVHRRVAPPRPEEARAEQLVFGAPVVHRDPKPENDEDPGGAGLAVRADAGMRRPITIGGMNEQSST